MKVRRSALARLWPLSGLGACAIACLTPRPAPEPERPIGVVERVVVDEGRARTLRAEVFYPAASASRPGAETQLAIYSLPVSRGAPFAPSGPRPLALLSHGSGGTRYDLYWLAEALVEAGFLVVTVAHPGDTFGDQRPVDGLQVWERPADLSAVLSELLADETWGPRIDEERIVAAGHSVGGFTVLALVGLRYDIDRAIDECFEVRMNDPTCIWVRQGGFDFLQIDYAASGSSRRDPRIKAAVAFTPAVAEAADVASARSIEVPVMIVGATRDQLTPFHLHAAAYASWIPDARFVVVDGADHYLAVTPCNALGRALDNCQDPEGFDRRAAQERLGREVSTFFRRAWEGGPGVGSQGASSDGGAP